jgi:hypothetical protein
MIQLKDCHAIIQEHYPSKSKDWVVNQLCRAYRNTDLTPSEDFTEMLKVEFGIFIDKKRSDKDEEDK